MPSIFIYDKFLIVAFESDTMETSLVHCLEHCYECVARVTIRGNEFVIFPGIALKTNDKSIILFILWLATRILLFSMEIDDV